MNRRALLRYDEGKSRAINRNSGQWEPLDWRMWIADVAPSGAMCFFAEEAGHVHMFPSTLFLLCVSLPYSSRTASRNPWRRWQAEHLLHQLHPSVTLLCSFLPISGPLAQQARPGGFVVC